MSKPHQAVPPTELVRWVEQVVAQNATLSESIGHVELQALSGDAGFRQYFRLATTPATLAVVAPPATEKNEAFVVIGQYLRERGVRTPKIIAYEPEQGFMLVEDLGQALLLDYLSPDTAEALYGEVLMSLLRLQQLPLDEQLFVPYSRDLLHSELYRFNEWFVTGLLGHSLSQQEQEQLNQLYQQLEDSALEQPRVITHRDFHARNLVYSAGTAPGVIDYQDAVAGPLTYDLVSLLRDCYIKWPQEQVQRWALAYAGMATDVGLLQDVPAETFLRWFDWMGLQRHIKVLGVFARLSLRDGKHGYLQDLPRVVSYVREVSSRYSEHPEVRDFHRWFEEVLMPMIQQQPWYSPGVAEA